MRIISVFVVAVRVLFMQALLIWQTFSSETDLCSPDGHHVIDDFRRSPEFTFHSEEQALCDLYLTPGWYRLKVNGSNAIIPTSCIEVNHCGTQSPIWLPVPDDGLPTQGQQKTVSGCGSWQIPGQNFRCCMYSYKIIVQRCSDFFVYNLGSTWACDMAYCAKVPDLSCLWGKKYYAEWDLCLEPYLNLSAPRVTFKIEDNIPVLNCSFAVQDDGHHAHWTYHIMWYIQDNTTSVLVQDSIQTLPHWAAIQVGRPVFPAQTVVCGIRAAVRYENLQEAPETFSNPYYLGVMVTPRHVTLKEDGSHQYVTFTSSLCHGVECNVTLKLFVTYADGSESQDLLLSTCEIVLSDGNSSACKDGVCSKQIQIQAKPDVTSHPQREIILQAIILSMEDKELWSNTNLSVLISLEDLPSLDCYVVHGVRIITTDLKQKQLGYGGTFVLLENQKIFFEVQFRVKVCDDVASMCVCGLALKDGGDIVVIDRCRPDQSGRDVDVDLIKGRSSHGIQLIQSSGGQVYIIALEHGARIRIDVTEPGLLLTLQAPGLYADGASGMCINDKVTHDKFSNVIMENSDEKTAEPYPRLLSGSSLFDNRYHSSSHETSTKPMPHCHCVETAASRCPVIHSVSSFLGLIAKWRHYYNETSNAEYNQTKTSAEKNQIHLYYFEPDYHFVSQPDSELSPSVENESIINACWKLFSESSIVRTCWLYLGNKIETVKDLCNSSVTPNENWLFQYLLLLESMCETNILRETTLESFTNNTDLIEAFLCRRNCSGHGMCTLQGCECYDGFTGNSCTEKIVAFRHTMPSRVSTTPSPALSTPISPSLTTTISPVSTIPSLVLTTSSPVPTATVNPKLTTPSHVPMTPSLELTTPRHVPTTPRPVPTKSSPVPTTPSPVPTTPSLELTTPSSVPTTPSPQLTTPSPVFSTEQILPVVSCDWGESRCVTHAIRGTVVLPTDVQCNVIPQQFVGDEWKSLIAPLATVPKLLSDTDVECELPQSGTLGLPRRINGYVVEVVNMAGEVFYRQVLMVSDFACEICDSQVGCTIRINTCLIADQCYEEFGINPENVCQQCVPNVNKKQWSDLANNRAPEIHIVSVKERIIIFRGDYLSFLINASDAENLVLHYSVSPSDATVTKAGEFQWQGEINSVTDEKRIQMFIITVTDECGAKSAVQIEVLVLRCGCLNGGSCVDYTINGDDIHYSCVCVNSFTGRTCEMNTDHCASDPCVRGSCVSELESYTCLCEDGFTGIRCSEDDDPCVDRPCYPEVACIQTQQTYMCGTCPPGMTGDGKHCLDMDGCRNAPCFQGVHCTDVPTPHAGFRCERCPRFFTGDGIKCRRTDDKACTCGVCSSLVACEDSVDYPGYRCGPCPIGYHGDGQSCSAMCDKPCGARQTCTSPGVCGCRPGYIGSDCDISVCIPHCKNRGICFRPNECRCLWGFIGDRCQYAICSPPCQNGGRCISRNVCLCPQGFTGPRCEKSTCRLTCQNGGQCDGLTSCKCSADYRGAYCEQPRCRHQCLNGGMCKRPGACSCPAGYRGTQCQLALCLPFCHNKGRCLRLNICRCQFGFYGYRCQRASCQKPCLNGGRCVAPGTCSCPSGWRGEHCQIPVCYFGCDNGGRCFRPDVCICPQGYWGLRCQYAYCWTRCNNGGRCIAPSTCLCRRGFDGPSCQRRIYIFTNKFFK